MNNIEAIPNLDNNKTVEFEIYEIKKREKATIFLSNGDGIYEYASIDIDGEKLNKLITESSCSSSDTAAIGTYKIFEGKIKIGDQTVRFTSDRYDKSGIIFIGGEVINRDADLFRRFPEIYNRSNLSGCMRVIRLDSGTFCPFRDNDKQIPRSKRTNF